MWVYLTENDKFNEFGNESALVWHETNILYAEWGPENTRTLTLNYPPTEVRLSEIVTATYVWFIYIQLGLYSSSFEIEFYGYNILFTVLEAQWEFICSCFLCTIWIFA